jgi:hypothetical protein
VPLPGPQCGYEKFSVDLLDADEQYEVGEIPVPVGGRAGGAVLLIHRGDLVGDLIDKRVQPEHGQGRYAADIEDRLGSHGLQFGDEVPFTRDIDIEVLPYCDAHVRRSLQPESVRDRQDDRPGDLESQVIAEIAATDLAEFPLGAAGIGIEVDQVDVTAVASTR